jgi:hypothetical protein
VFFVATSAGACCCRSSPSPPQNNLPHCQPLQVIPQVLLLDSSSSFIYSSPAIARYPQSSALFILLCVTWHSCRNANQSDMTSSTVTAKQI